MRNASGLSPQSDSVTVRTSTAPVEPEIAQQIVSAYFTLDGDDLYTIGTCSERDIKGIAAGCTINIQTRSPAFAADGTVDSNDRLNIRIGRDRAAVDGAELTLTFNEALDENSEPATTAFTVTVSGAVRAVDSVDMSGSAVSLTLASAVTSQDTMTVSYTVPVSESDDRLRDTVGNAAATFANRSVTNETTPPPAFATSIHDVPESHNGTDAFS